MNQLLTRVAAILCISALLTTAAVAEVDESGRLIVPRTGVAPVIDGELDGVWHNVGETRCLITDIVNADSATPEDWYDLFATFKAMYDADNFYIFVQVQDSVLDEEFSNWNGDGVEIFFDGDNSKGATYDGVNDNQIRITVDDVELADIDSSLPVEGTAFKVLLTDLGYDIEASFPLEALQISPAVDPEPAVDANGVEIPDSGIDPNNIIGFEVQINDNDAGGGRETLMRWHSNDNDSWQNASLFGEARLVSRTVGNMLDVRRVAFDPNVDGVMEADWYALPEITCNKYVLSNSDLSEQNDFTDARFSFRTGWDDENIYLFVSVIDDLYYDLQTNHQADGVELFFDADNSKGTTRDDGRYDGVDDVQLRINHADLTPADIDITGGQWGPANVTKDNINFVVVDTPIGYDVEVAIPLADLAIPAENGHVFGFDLFLNDADEDIRDNIRNYWSGNNDNWRYSGLFGEAVLIPGAAEGLVALYRFENNVADVSGNGRNGMLLGADPNDPNDLDFVDGMAGYGMALDLDGVDDVVELGKFDVMGQITLAAWVKADGFGINDARLISKAKEWGGNDHWWMISTIAETSLRFRLKTANGGATATLISDPVLEAGVWAHVAATWDGTMMRIYKDGAEVASQDKGGTVVAVDPTVSAAIGSQPSDAYASDPSHVVKFFDGLIDEVRVYDRALSDTEVAALAAVE
jgi:hypothetical protein